MQQVADKRTHTRKRKGSNFTHPREFWRGWSCRNLKEESIVREMEPDLVHWGQQKKKTSSVVSKLLPPLLLLKPQSPSSLQQSLLLLLLYYYYTANDKLPGGPHKIIDGRKPLDDSSLRMSRTWVWPTKSLQISGRIRSASGWSVRTSDLLPNTVALLPLFASSNAASSDPLSSIICPRLAPNVSIADFSESAGADVESTYSGPLHPWLHFSPCDPSILFRATISDCMLAFAADKLVAADKLTNPGDFVRPEGGP